METRDFIFRLLELLVTNFAIVAGAIWLWRKNLKLMPKEIEKAELENDKQEANIAEQMQSIASTAAAQVVEYQKAITLQNEEIGRLKREVEEVLLLKREVTKLRADLNAYKAENQVLREWANALVNQVSKYESPVPMPVLKKREANDG